MELLNADFSSKLLNLNSIPYEFRHLIGSASFTFCLASITVNGKKWNPIIRKTTSVDMIGLTEDLYLESTGGSTSWGSDNYINIWIADTGPHVLGFGTLPGLVEEYKQGVVINPDVFGANNHSRYNMGRVLTHEIGHYLGLLHLWGHGSSCEYDDQVEDTPRQSMPYFGCPVFPQHSCGSEDMFMNFMDYTDDGCMHFFTKGQMERMVATLSHLRPLLGHNGEYCSMCEREKPEADKLYPNPGKGVMHVSFNPVDFSPYFGAVAVYDQSGKLIESARRLLFSGMEVDLSHLNPGVYFIQINSKTLRYVKV
jgi:hypothetical protein